MAGCQISLHVVSISRTPHGHELTTTSGDSYTSTSFNIHGTQPSPENPLGNPAYPGATSANGPNYVDFLTTTYNQSFIETFNLGYGGATIDPSLVGSPYGLIVQSFRQQVEEEFLSTYASNSGVGWSGSNSLFTVFFGINDVILSYGQRNSTLNFLLIKSYENLVHEVRTPLENRPMVDVNRVFSYMPLGLVTSSS